MGRSKADGIPRLIRLLLDSSSNLSKEALVLLPVAQDAVAPRASVYPEKKECLA